MPAVVASTLGIYLFLLVILRLMGRRRLGQLTALDLVVVLVLGSAVETSMIHGDVSLQAGLVSAATLLIVNRIISWVLMRSPRLRHLVNGGPILLVQDGRPVATHLKRLGMSDDDLVEALRGKGYSNLTDVHYAVLETDGTVTVVPHDGRRTTRGGSPA